MNGKKRNHFKQFLWRKNINFSSCIYGFQRKFVRKCIKFILKICLLAYFTIYPTKSFSPFLLIPQFAKTFFNISVCNWNSPLHIIISKKRSSCVFLFFIQTHVFRANVLWYVTKSFCCVLFFRLYIVTLCIFCLVCASIQFGGCHLRDSPCLWACILFSLV